MREKFEYWKFQVHFKIFICPILNSDDLRSHFENLFISWMYKLRQNLVNGREIKKSIDETNHQAHNKWEHFPQICWTIYLFPWEYKKVSLLIFLSNETIIGCYKGSLLSWMRVNQTILYLIMRNAFRSLFSVWVWFLWVWLLHIFYWSIYFRSRIWEKFPWVLYENGW